MAAPSEPAPTDRAGVTPPAEPSGVTPTATPSHPKPAGRGVRRLAAPLVAAVVAAVVAAAVWLGVAGGSTAAPDAGRWLPSSAPAAPWAGSSATARAPGDPFAPRAAPLTAPPTRVRVPAIGVDSPLERLRIGANGELTTPRDFGQAGWYADGTAPGDVGPAVIAGHVDSVDGPAVFFRLRELAAGDTIEVSRGDQQVTFTVVSTAWYPKSAFPTERVYGPTPDRQLRLITCGGGFDPSRRSYRDNLVVYAVAG
ncbi:class F sortase [Spirilliplanes yamanashiensis]|uniref:Class F sortase n=1 Tax=Spirilliplanes yamanashiensis TaxID=42233 RepID=A0A8J3Y4H3_9ACTN|nr:class F sortase [Spirilliplanes yamanashiensis]MDP9819598.1 hypothetical protein [Spirilliplanes yamanashiensis]GIJ01581.1 hypothetical protein Sya03_09330 [Spirilliplanes yamanashiensis]